MLPLYNRIHIIGFVSDKPKPIICTSNNRKFLLFYIYTRSNPTLKKYWVSFRCHVYNEPRISYMCNDILKGRPLFVEGYFEWMHTTKKYDVAVDKWAAIDADIPPKEDVIIQNIGDLSGEHLLEKPEIEEKKKVYRRIEEDETTLPNW